MQQINFLFISDCPQQLNSLFVMQLIMAFTVYVTVTATSGGHSSHDGSKGGSQVTFGVGGRVKTKVNVELFFSFFLLF